MKRLMASALGFCVMSAALISATAASALQISGQPIQGGLLVAFSEPGAKVFVNGIQYPVFDDGRTLLPFERSQEPKILVREILPNGQVNTLELDVIQRDYKTERINNLPSSRVTPPTTGALQRRVDRELEEISKAREVFTPYALFDSGFDWPVKGRITGVYGSQRVLNGIPRTPHYGIDIAAPRGTSIKAPADGVVRLIHTDNYYSGGTLILDHGYGLNSAFLHMQAFNVDVGDTVAKGTVIGTVGSTGRSTGPHLDWRITYNGVRVDPELVAGEMPN